MELIAEKRQKLGKASKSLRKLGQIPASIFGKGFDTVSVAINETQAKKLYAEAGETTLIDIKVENQSYKTLIQEVQFDPVSGKIIFANFYKPDLTIKTEVQVPVDVINEELNPLVKSGEGVVLTIVNEITVRALPSDLPHSFVVDAAQLLELGQGVTVAELSYDREKVEIMDIEQNEVVVRLDKVEVQEEPEEAVNESEAIAGLEATAEKEEEADEGKEE